MKQHIAALLMTALVLGGSISAGHAEDAAATQAAPATPSTDAPPVSVPRPSLAPKAEPANTASATTQTTADATPVRHRRYARRHIRHGYYRTAYWEPFPIYWPHVYRSRIHWNRIPWMFNF